MRQFICSCEEGKDNKKYWNRIGEVLTFSGQQGTYQKIKLYHIPGVLFSVFEDKNQQPKNEGW